MSERLHSHNIGNTPMATPNMYDSSGEGTSFGINPSLTRSYGTMISTLDGLNLESDPDIEEKMRSRLKLHYMNAYQKYKTGNRKPWKLLVQIIKIVLVTAQIVWFGDLRFSVINYLDETHEVFQHLFLVNPNITSNSLYTRNSLYNQLNFTTFQYENIQDITLGTYGYTCGDDPSNCPVKMCVHQYNDSVIKPGQKFFNIPHENPVKTCGNITSIGNGSITEFALQNNIPNQFYSVVAVDLRVSLQAIKVSEMKFGNPPQCIQFNVRLSFKNEKHTGKFKADLHTVPTYLDCDKDSYPKKSDFNTAEVIFDIVVILVCVWSFVLTARSFIKNVRLAMFTFKFFKVTRKETLSFISDGAELVNIWFLIILLTDIVTVVGSIIKIYIDTTNLKEKYFYDVCSLCLGLSVLFIWIGILRYLGFLHKYNVLLVTLQASLPSVLRFLSCAVILYFGFMFCGWIILGPYHPKFTSLSEVSECLFSLINGDDMFMTFREMQKDNYRLWVFSKVYLYLFISLFIYVVLSLFIGIISDTYERLQSGEHIMCSNVRRFIHGPECSCFTRSEMIKSGHNT